MTQLKSAQYEKDILRYAIFNYGYLMQADYYTYQELADNIAKHYDTENPQNKEVVRILKNTHSKGK